MFNRSITFSAFVVTYVLSTLSICEGVGKVQYIELQIYSLWIVRFTKSDSSLLLHLLRSYSLTPVQLHTLLRFKQKFKREILDGKIFNVCSNESSHDFLTVFENFPLSDEPTFWSASDFHRASTTNRQRTASSSIEMFTYTVWCFPSIDGPEFSWLSFSVTQPFTTMSFDTLSIPTPPHRSIWFRSHRRDVIPRQSDNRAFSHRTLHFSCQTDIWDSLRRKVRGVQRIARFISRIRRLFNAIARSADADRTSLYYQTRIAGRPDTWRLCCSTKRRRNRLATIRRPFLLSTTSSPLGSLVFAAIARSRVQWNI